MGEQKEWDKGDRGGLGIGGSLGGETRGLETERKRMAEREG